ncbi:hypothetical protein [Fibrella aquatica]|jgi:hypothetical protein|uniref:hypothetical protein n=1 Tax=Fibrella aquatica TaxID=3242487 RepID=UPI00352008F9
MNAEANTPRQPFNPGKWLFCLVGAGLFWIMNALNKEGYSLNVEYPVHFEFNESNYIPTTTLPRTVKVNVSGDGWDLLRLSWLPFRTEPVNYEVNNPMRASIINTSAMTAALADQIKNLKVNYVVADTLEMSFDHRITKTIRLVADSTHIDMLSPFVVSSVINLTPATITVQGPARLLKGFSDTMLIKIPGRRISANYDEELPITAFRHPLVQRSADKVFVSFEVGELLSPLPAAASKRK